MEYSQRARFYQECNSAKLLSDEFIRYSETKKNTIKNIKESIDNLLKEIDNSKNSNNIITHTQEKILPLFEGLINAVHNFEYMQKEPVEIAKQIKHHITEARKLKEEIQRQPGQSQPQNNQTTQTDTTNQTQQQTGNVEIKLMEFSGSDFNDISNFKELTFDPRNDKIVILDKNKNKLNYRFDFTKKSFENIPYGEYYFGLKKQDYVNAYKDNSGNPIEIKDQENNTYIHHYYQNKPNIFVELNENKSEILVYFIIEKIS